MQCRYEEREMAAGARSVGRPVAGLDAIQAAVDDQGMSVP